MATINPIAINPQSPSSDDGLLFVFNYPENGCSATVKTVVGSHFYYEQTGALGPCIGTPVPYEASWNVGRLDAGSYQVTLTTKFGSSDTEDFSVTQGVLPPPVLTPVIPTFGLTGAMVLVIGLALIAHRWFRTARQSRID